MRRGVPEDKNSRTLAARRRRAFKAAKESQGRLEAMLVTAGPDVRWLTGFGGDDSFVLFTASKGVLITDGRFGEQAKNECPGLEIHVRTGPMSDAVAGVAKRLGVRKLGIQAEAMTVQAADVLKRKLGSAPLRVVNAVGPLRAVKDDVEVAAIVKAAKAAQGAFKSLLEMGRDWWIGKTENHIGAELDYRMRLAGAEKPAFETIVAVGAHASLPHYRPGSTRVRADGIVLIDWGAMVGGYCSDLTRVVFTGRIPPKIGEIHQVVLLAQEAGIKSCRAGAKPAAVDQAARDVIEKAGYGKQFIHSLGHGLGLEVHESPALSKSSDKPLKSGMVVTIEPGIYLPGVGGVRIEDDVLVQAGGCRILTSLPKTPAAMTLR
ncbi:MAG: aminopeptidase P family protein [Planctomycetes bacterium]|jgi:Xaa-Pro aminopeptidase|nr:aminopeptidase P family protein [Planctomycetota bacterium]